MLIRIRKLLAHHWQASASSLRGLCNSPVATMLTALVIALTLTLPALFWVFTDNLSQLTLNWQRSGHISLYLRLSASHADENALLERLRKTPGVGHAILIPPSEALKELQQQEGMQDMLRYLPENPLPATIDIIPTSDVNTPAALELLFAELKSDPLVEQAKLDMEWIQRLYAILGFAAKLSHALMALLALAVLLIIGNTLRLAIHNHYEEIQVLKLVGATDAYIARPFLYSGIWYGVAGTFFALLLISLFLASLSRVVERLASVYQLHYSLSGLSFRQASLLMLSAILLGWLGACLSVRRQLTSIEPYN